MTLLYTEVEEELRASVRDLLADRCAADAVLRRVESDDAVRPGPVEDAVRGRSGWRACSCPRSYGGAGASAREVAVVLEELGRAVAPVPFLTSAVLATEALLDVGEEDADPGTRLGGARPRRWRCRWRPRRTGRAGDRHRHRTGGLLNGEMHGRWPARTWPTCCSCPSGRRLYAVDAEDVRTSTCVPSLDLTRPIATVTLSAAPGPAARPARVRRADGR